ncbi:hypothetical protein B6U90_05910 [Thermoplasmatales archaeon ex4484_6]|nr:MAG: hypothetical protein B6U90_05910 [Thermoplasmatales archaeon ex4484_6]RLF67542.1 MAG: hypothetical protein DRN57_05580 [Thermoplasmata archaeon]
MVHNHPKACPEKEPLIYLLSYPPSRVMFMEGENEQDEGADMEEDMAKLLTSVKDMGLYNLSMIATQAWHHLGLAPIPGSGESRVDLDQARLAIDLYEANLNILKDVLESDTEKQLRRVLMDLQLNYVNKTKKE